MIFRSLGHIVTTYTYKHTSTTVPRPCSLPLLLAKATMPQMYHRTSASRKPPPVPSISADGEMMELIPVPTKTTKKILVLLISILCFAITDLILALLRNLGLSSVFLGVIASAGTITHISILLGIIFYRRRSHSDTTKFRDITWDTHIHPTSKVSCIALNILLIIVFLASATFSIFAQKTGYFSRGSDEEGTQSVLRGPVEIIYVAVVVEVVCAVEMLGISLIGYLERRQFIEKIERSVSLKTQANRSGMPGV